MEDKKNVPAVPAMGSPESRRAVLHTIQPDCQVKNIFNFNGDDGTKIFTAKILIRGGTISLMSKEAPFGAVLKEGAIGDCVFKLEPHELVEKGKIVVCYKVVDVVDFAPAKV